MMRSSFTTRGGLPRLSNNSSTSAAKERLSRSKQRIQRILRRGQILLYLSFALMTFTLNMVFFARINAGRSDIHGSVPRVSTNTTTTKSVDDILKDNTLHLQKHLDTVNQIDRTNPSYVKAFNTNKSWWRGRQADNQLNSTDFTRNGARHPNGTLGMIVDPSPERLHLPLDDPTKNPLFCPHSASASQGVNSPLSSLVSFEGAAANIVLQKIRKGMLNSRAFLQGQVMNDSKVEHDKGLRAAAVGENTTSTQQRRRSRILCMVYTVHIPGENNHSNVRSQAETWGRQCDGFIAASNFTDHSVGAIDLVHNGPEEYGNMWQKTRSMLAYAYQHYLDEFDFFYMCGDDVYIYMDNLRAYLDGPEVLRLENGYIDKISSGFHNNSALFNENHTEFIIGFKNYAELNAAIKNGHIRGHGLSYLALLFSHKRMPMISGGPGYTLNRAALRVFAERSLAHFFPNAHDSREDMYLGGALAEHGIFVSDTKDVNDGDRYGGSATSVYNFKGVSPIGTQWLKQYFELKYKKGIDSISEQFVASHLKDSKMEMIEINRTIPELMRRYHVILNDLCEHGYR